MNFVQWGVNPWGQQILTHLSWDLLWWAIGVGILFVVAHAIYVRVRGPQAHAPAAATSPAIAGLPERIGRHGLGARLFHWGMTVAMLALLVTGFLPIVGIQFGWVTIHWIAGLALVAVVLYHIVHVLVRRSLAEMWVTAADRRDARLRVGRALGARAQAPGKPAKYPLENKLYHHIITLTSVAVIATGLLMMVRIPTPFWARNPYLLSDFTWGVVYVLHGLTSVALVTLIMVHVYFAIRPEKLWLTWSMIYGWIGRAEYLQYHDPQRWAVASAPPPEAAAKTPAAH
jgi:cytochrome b subunit of formate dehydrogenase